MLAAELGERLIGFRVLPFPAERGDTLELLLERVPSPIP
jgi:hypothetical protein